MSSTIVTWVVCIVLNPLRPGTYRSSPGRNELICPGLVHLHL